MSISRNGDHEFSGNAVRIARRVKLTGKICVCRTVLFRGGQRYHRTFYGNWRGSRAVQGFKLRFTGLYIAGSFSYTDGHRSTSLLNTENLRGSGHMCLGFPLLTYLSCLRPRLAAKQPPLRMPARPRQRSLHSPGMWTWFGPWPGSLEARKLWAGFFNLVYTVV